MLLKALSDRVYRAKGLHLRTLDDVEIYLFDLNPGKIEDIALGYGSRRVTMLSEYIRHRGGKS